ncbi:MAG: HmuY family protein [Nevskiales bacterium]
MNWLRILILSLVLPLALSACGSGSDDSGSDSGSAATDSSSGDNGGNSDAGSSNNDTGNVGETATSNCSAADADGVISCVVDATSYTDFVFFDFETGETVNLSEAQARSSDAWDIALRRYTVKSNGGSSSDGTSNAGGALAAAQDDFYDANGDPNSSVFTNATAAGEREHLVTTLAIPDDWTEDSVVTTFDVEPVSGDYGWYLYNFTDGNIGPNPGNGWILRSGEGDSYARMRVTGLDFPTRSGNGVQSFEISFDVQPSGVSSFSTTATFTGSIPGEGGEICFDFDNDQTVACSGKNWDIKIGFVGRDFFLNTNSGPNGDGDAGGFGPLPWADAQSYTNGTTGPGGEPLALLYQADADKSIVNLEDWYAYNLSNQHQLWPNYRVYMINSDITDDNSALYAIQIINYYHPSTGVSGHISFNYRVVERP